MLASLKVCPLFILKAENISSAEFKMAGHLPYNTVVMQLPVMKAVMSKMFIE